MEDTTLSECLKAFGDSKLQIDTDFLNNWLASNNMRLNETKAKEMVISFRKSDIHPESILASGYALDRVSAFAHPRSPCVECIPGAI